MLVQFENVFKSYNGNTILKDISFTIQNQDVIGLIGVNGAGKSTLLNLICGRSHPDSGNISIQSGIHIGLLEQNSGLLSNNTIGEEMKSVFSSLLDLKAQLRNKEEQLQTLVSQGIEETDTVYKNLAEEYAKEQELFERQDGYLIDVKIRSVLNGMGFSDRTPECNIDTLSGGEKTRLALAKLLLQQPELLILDEPTNHLDFKTLTWLEEYLLAYKGAILVVSHDRYFLDKLTHSTWEIERGRLKAYKGAYSKFIILKEENFVRQSKEYEVQQQKIASLKEYIAKNMVRASTAASAKSREKELERMDLIEKPLPLNSQVHFSFSVGLPTGKEVLNVEELSIRVGEGETSRQLFHNMNMQVLRGERVAIIGSNGIGKTSFLKAVQGIIPSQGRISWGKNVKISYYEQQGKNLNPENSIIDELWNRFPRLSQQQIRSALGTVLLTGENVFKKVGVISGGEKARLNFAVIMLEHSNVLLLDEPTNHLDLATKEVLEKALLEYEGTIILVSHDRYLLNKVPTKIVDMRSNGIFQYTGGYDVYLEKTQQEKAMENASMQAAKNAPQQIKANKASNYRGKAERARQVQLKNQKRQMEEQIEQLELDICHLEEEISSSEVYSDYRIMHEKCSQLEEYKNQRDALLEQWMLLEEQ